MKKFRKTFLPLLCVLALTVALLAGCGGNTDKPTGDGGKPVNKTIAVVAKGESHAFWQSVKAGAVDAGKKYGYEVTFQGPASESAKDLPSQMEMVSTALNNNPAGLVLGTIGEGFVDSLKHAFTQKIPVVQFDSGIWAKDIESLDSAKQNPIVSSVATSNRLAAGLAAEKFKALADADSTTAGKYTIEKEVKPGDADQAYKAALEALFEKGVKAIFMSNEGVVKQVYDAIGAAGSKYDNIVFCGFDAGSKQIEWMKKTTGPKLIGSVAQDSYRSNLPHAHFRVVWQVLRFFRTDLFKCP